MPIRLILFSILLMAALGVSAQSTDSIRIAFIQERLYALSQTEVPGLNEKVAASVSNINLSEFVRGMAISNNLNISVDPDLKLKITVNFSNESVMNILLFLCKQYNLEITFTGSIMYISTYALPPTPTISKSFVVDYAADKELLSLDLRNDTLYQVLKKITQVSGRNIVTTTEVNNKLVSVFLKDMPINSALDKLAYANELSLTVADDGTFVLAKGIPPLANSPQPTDKNKNQSQNKIPELSQNFLFQLGTSSTGAALITLNAINTPIADIIKVISQELKINYFIFSEPQGTTTVNISNQSYEEFLSYVLRGTEYTYEIEGGMYLIGNRIQEGFTETRFIKLLYRPTDIVIENIPAELKKGTEVKAFPELNSLIVTGSLIKVNQIEAFVRSIDQIVPVIVIEVLIIDVNSNRIVATGISAGITDEPVKTSGTVFPGIDLTLSSASINNLLGLLSGTGLVNMGKVTPSFYVTLKALEQQGIIKIRSTPKLSTLNGHEASMSIGKTDYYVEQTNNIIGTQNPQTVITRTFKPVNADFSITINPVVSGDDHVTLSITVKQSDFTQRISVDAPPGTSTRSFESLIRVKSDEMVILGGLEEVRISETGTGVPLLSRIPVLKWFFSSREKTKSETKLHIFIKPTIIY